jgi:methionyl-tRNA synthetase
MEKGYFLTTPIYYVNDVPHIGHAYTSVLTDSYARFFRRWGYPTWFSTGTDEHGQKIARSAEEKKLSPKELADQVVVRFRELWKVLKISYDDFIRTTEERHKKVVWDFWNRIYQRGDIYLGKYQGFYCISCEAYYSEKELIDSRCPICRKKPEFREEPSYFFRLSAYQEPLLKFYEEHPDFIFPPERFREVISFVQQGLQDLSISRRYLKWGIPVPSDPDHVIYVWIDALVNYLTVLNPLDPQSTLFATFWPPRIHFIGKDIVRFHGIYWPALLMSAGYPLPKTIVAHGWWLVEGQKMSKSLGNQIDPFFLVEKFGVDSFRYFLLREVPLGEDGDFRESHLLHRYNGELANALGNLCKRIHTMVEKYSGGKLPDPPLSEEVEKVRRQFSETVTEIKESMEGYRPHLALEALFQWVTRWNRYIDQTQPWSLYQKESRKELTTALQTLSLALYYTQALSDPFLPQTAETIRNALRVLHLFTYPDLIQNPPPIPWGEEIGKLPVLFPKKEPLKKEEEKEKKASSVEVKQKEKKEGISYEEFLKIEMVVGVIKEAKRVPGSEKLLELKVDLGEEKERTILAGIATSYTPEEVIGKRVMVVKNLLPKKMMGKMSEGMILAGSSGGKIHLIEPPSPLPPGTPIR